MSPEELERVLRATLADRAAQAPDPEQLSRRVLADVAMIAATPDPAGSRKRAAASADRSRRRRFGRLLVPLASAACVAAVVGLGVAVAHNDTRPSSADSTSLTGAEGTAAGQTPAGQGSAGATTAGPGVAPGAPSASRASGTLSGLPPNTAVPTTFQVADLSFDSPGSGFALGTTACPAGRCAALARSTDPASWSLVSATLPFAVDPSATANDTSVSHIRFATASIGYAYGPGALFLTSDGGVHWTNAGSSALALEVADGSVVRVSATGCAGTCTYALSVAAVGTTHFADITLATPLAGSGVVLARAGENIYVAVTAGSGNRTLLSSTDGGQNWAPQAGDACAVPAGVPGASVPAGSAGSAGSSAGPTGSSVPVTISSIAASADGSVTALCTSGSTQYTSTSVDHGRTFARGTAIPAGPVTALAAASARVLVVGGSTLLRSTDGGRSWTSAAGLATSAGATRFLGFQNDSLGRWVSGDGQKIWSTSDSGASYSKYAFS